MFVAVVTQTGGGTLFSQNAAIIWWVAPVTCLIGAIPVMFLSERYRRQNLDLRTHVRSSNSQVAPAIELEAGNRQDIVGSAESANSNASKENKKY